MEQGLAMTTGAKAGAHAAQSSWLLEPQGDDGWLIVVDGAIDARFEYAEILGEGLAGPGRVTIDLAGVTRIDCQGVSRFARLVEALAVRQLAVCYRRCSIAVVTRINQVPLLLRHAAVESVFAPYCCEATGEEALRLLEVAQLDGLHEPPPFLDARGCFTFDELPARFFAFVARSRWATPRPCAAAAGDARRAGRPLGEER